jgi:hypothetical protein
LKKGGRTVFEYTVTEHNEFSNYGFDILNKVIYASAMDSLKEFRRSKFQNIIRGAGFRNINVRNIGENVALSLNRFMKFALAPNFFVKLFRLQK